MWHFAECAAFSLNENSGAVTALATIVIAAFTVVLWVATSQQAQLTEKQLRSPGTSLKAMPHVATVLRWLPEHPEFRDQYMLAREQQAEHRADEIVEMADSILPRDGRPADHAEVQAMRLAIDTRKWVLSKLLPRKYGDRVGVEASGSVTVRVVQGLGDEC